MYQSLTALAFADRPLHHYTIMIHVQWLTAYKNSNSAKMEAIICAWLLFISTWLPSRGVELFIPEIWRPIFPFHFFNYTDTKMAVAIWAWRAILFSCILIPRNTLLLGLAFLFSFFCLGIQNCFVLEMQLFASLQISMFFLFFFSLLSHRYGNMDKYLAFSIKFTMILLFFSAGLSKIKWDGLHWALSENLQKNFQWLYQIHRNVFGYEWVLNLRQQLIENPSLIKWGSISVLLFELISPLAFFYQRASRFLVISGILFILFVLIFFGINFYATLPLLLIWGVWDIHIKDVFPHPRTAPKPINIAFAALTVAQLTVTLFSTKNYWPIMANDMYAKPIPKLPSVATISTSPFLGSPGTDINPMHDFSIQVVNRDGSEATLTENFYFHPFTRSHILIALLKLKDNDDRNALLEKVFANYRQYTCVWRCHLAEGLFAIEKFNGSTLILAQTKTE